MTGGNHAIPSQTTEEAISQLLHGNKELQPPANAKNEARLKDFDAECKRAADDLEKFWAEIAKELHWHEPWTKVFDWKYPTFEWFIGGRCNVTYNCLDRQVKAGRRNKVAYIFANEDGSERQITYGQLLDLVGKSGTD
jgi:acetyl-CoA synthetase